MRRKALACNRSACAYHSRGEKTRLLLHGVLLYSALGIGGGHMAGIPPVH